MRRLGLKYSIFFTALIVGALLTLGKDNVGHVGDAVKFLFGGETNPQSQELVEYISRGMDMGSDSHPVSLCERGSSYLTTLRADFKARGFNGLSGLGSHRAIAHWGFGGDIPGDFMNAVGNVALEQARKRGLSPEATEALVREMKDLAKSRWIEFVHTRTAAVKQVFGLTGKQGDKVAHSIASLIYDTHLLGDHTTKDVLDLPRLKTIIADIYRNLDNIFGRGVSEQIKKAIWAEAKDLAGSARATKILEILARYGQSERPAVLRILRRLGYTGSLKDIDYALLKAAGRESWVGESEMLTLVRKLSTKLEKCQVVRMTKEIGKAYNGSVDKLSQNLAKRADGGLGRFYTTEKLKTMKDVRATRNVTGFLQEVTLDDGRTRLVLSVPKKQLIGGIKAGVNAGVATFVFEEGATLYQYATGDISDEDFAWESARNCAASMMTGAGTFVAVTLGAAPGGFIVLGVGIGSYLICDIAFKELRLAVEGEHVDLDDILWGCPTDVQRRLTSYDLIGEGASAADRARYDARRRAENASGCLWGYLPGRVAPLYYMPQRPTIFDVNINKQ